MVLFKRTRKSTLHCVAVVGVHANLEAGTGGRAGGKEGDLGGEILMDDGGGGGGGTAS